MSQWTHVNGSIRLEGMLCEEAANKAAVIKQIEQAFGNMALWEDDEETKDKCSVPTGSEGSLQYFIVCEGEAGSSNTGPNGEFETADYRWIVTIVGDLRDYNDANEIVDWIKKSTEKLWVREAVVKITVEFLKDIILTFDGNNKWQTTERKYEGY